MLEFFNSVCFLCFLRIFFFLECSFFGEGSRATFPPFFWKARGDGRFDFSGFLTRVHPFQVGKGKGETVM